MLGSADLSLVTLNKQLGHLNVPSKTYSIMASARPILASVPDNSEIASLVKKAECGVIVPPEDPFSLARAILDLKRTPKLLEQFGLNGREFVVRNYSRHQIVRRHHHLLHEAAHSDNH